MFPNTRLTSGRATPDHSSSPTPAPAFGDVVEFSEINWRAWFSNNVAIPERCHSLSIPSKSPDCSHLVTSLAASSFCFLIGEAEDKRPSFI